MQQFANPARFLKLANAVLPYVWAVTAILFVIGLYGALVTSPPDYQQGETVRIMYVHVPAAWLGLFIYCAMAFFSAIAIIFRHPLADAAARTAARRLSAWASDSRDCSCRSRRKRSHRSHWVGRKAIGCGGPRILGPSFPAIFRRDRRRLSKNTRSTAISRF